MKILVAEDDPITLEAISTSLENEGFQVAQATHGKAALDQWKREQPDLICLDIMMPQLDGFEVCRQIRAVDPEIPVLFLSAKNEERDVVAGLNLGADDFVRKPFGRQELVARIRSALRRIPAEESRKTSFSMGDLLVFPRELRAERENQSIDLTPRETGILCVLKEKQGEMVTRDELLKRCWGVEYHPDSRTLDQHISTLRKKVERDREHPEVIETVRGIGYRFVG